MTRRIFNPNRRDAQDQETAFALERGDLVAGLDNCINWTCLGQYLPIAQSCDKITSDGKGEGGSGEGGGEVEGEAWIARGLSFVDAFPW